MVERTVRVSLVGDAASLIGAVGAARTALMGLSNVNLGTVRAGLGAAGGAAQEAGEKSGSFLDKLNTGLGVFGVEASFNGIVDGFKSVISAGLEYQASLNTLHAVTGAGTTMMGKLGDKAKELGADLTIPGASAASAADAMVALAKGGFDVDQTMTAAKGTLMLAAAAQIDGARAAEIQVNALNAFRLGAEKAGFVADILSNAANAASGEITDMAQGLQQSATVASGFGISIDDTSTTLALFAKNGIIGSDAGTSFKTMLQQLASPTKAQQEAMTELNLEIYDASGNFVGMKSVTEQLAAAHTRLTTQQYNSAASTLFGTDAIRAANILGQEGTKGWEDMSASVHRYDGAAILAGAQTAGLNGKLDAFNTTVSTAATNLFERLQPSLMKITEWSTTVASAVGSMTEMFGNMPAILQAPVFALGAILLLRGPLVSFFSLLMKTKVGSTLATQFAAGGTAMRVMRTEAVMTGTAVSGMSVRMAGAAVTAKGLGVAMKSMLLNPVAIAIAAITTAITLFASAQEDATQQVTDFSDVLDQNTGKILDNSRAKFADTLAISGSFDAYEKIGGNVNQYTDALMGNTQAQADVKSKILDAAEAAVLQSSEWTRMSVKGQALGETSRTVAQGLLDSGNAGNYNSTAMTSAIEASTKFTVDTNTLAETQNHLRQKLDASGSATGSTEAQIRALATAQELTTKQSQDMADAIDGVMKSFDGASTMAIGFKDAVDATRSAQQAADVAAQAFSLSLLQNTGGALDSAKAQRANEAAMRLMSSASRAHEAAIASVTDKEQALADLQNWRSVKADEINRASEASDKAAADAATAQTELMKAQAKATKDLADAQDALQKAKDKAWRDEQDAKDALPDVQDKAAKDLRDAQEALAKAQADPTSDAIELRNAQEKVAQTAKDGASAVADAQQKISDAHESGADSVQSAQERVDQAQQSGADSIASAQERLTQATQSAADAQENAAQVARDAAPTQAELAAATRAVKDANDSVADSAAAMADAVDKAGQSARDMASAAGSVQAANGDMTGAIAASQATMQTQRDAFIASAEAAGYGHDEAVLMADAQGLIPANVPIAYTTSGYEGAKHEADTLNAALDDLLRKTGTPITIRWNTVGNLLVPVSKEQSDNANGMAVNHGYAPYDYGFGTAPTGTSANYEYGYYPADLHADGGYITGPGGPRDDKISAPWLSNGEFVVNAAQTAKHRSLLEAINNSQMGFADGGEVPGGTAVAATAATASTAATTDWPAMSATMAGAWNDQMLPVFDSLTVRNTQLAKEFDTLNKEGTIPAWTAIGVLISKTWTDTILPTYDAMNVGSHGIADTWDWLHNASAVPHWTQMRDFIDASWNGNIASTYAEMNAGTDNVGITFENLSNTTVSTWSAIGATITGVYNGQIVPAWTGVQGFVNEVWNFFSGAQAGMTAASTQITTDLATITTKIDEFFKMVDGKAPVAATAGTDGATVATATVPVNGTLADGGPITWGTTGRADDVLIAVSKGEYVVNAQAAAAHRPELDAMNFGGAFADGGSVGEKIGNRVSNAIIGGAERAIDAGVDRLLASVPAGVGGVGGVSGTSTATGYTGSYDPSSFGWVRAANQQPYSWNGHNFGEVAGGTQGLWNALLNQLVPTIPGGLNSNIGGFEDRSIAGTNTPSFHSYGLALDINSDVNGRGLPGYGRTGQYVIAGEPAHAIAAQLGMQWGGDWSYTDPMHFEIHVPPAGISAAANSQAVANSQPADPPATWAQTVVDKIKRGGTGSTSNSTSGLLVSSDPGMWGSTRLQDTTTPTTLFSPMSMSRGTAANVGPVPPGDAIERWRPLYLHAMAMLGKNPLGIDKMMYQMFRESSGNPLSYAIDGNYYAGKPSKGLLQTIPSTFVGNAPPGYNTNIWDPLSNALASLNYIGDPMNYPGGAYANGGIVGTDSVPAMLTPGEAVISPFSTDKDRQKALVNHAANWFDGDVNYGSTPASSWSPVTVAAPVIQIHNYVDATGMLSRTEVLIDGKMADLADRISTKQVQSR